MRFTASELERYGRQIVLPDVGGVGQERLRAASVLLVGAGGLGAPAALYLAAAGVGRLVLVDDDRVSVSNLQRQVLYTTADVDRLKVEAAAERLGALNPEIAIETRPWRLTEANAEALVAAVDLVLDGTDSFETRALTARAAARARRPLVSGSVQGLEGQLTLFAPSLRPGTPCFRCLYAQTPAADALPSCAMGGILGPVAGQLGAMMATEAIKWIMGLGDDLVGALLLVDGRLATVDRIRLARRAGCTGGCTNGSTTRGERSPLAPTAGDD